MAGRYRKRGLDATARRMVGFLEQQGIEGATVLEIGGGVGEIGLELLRRGAERAVNLELSPAYDAEAARLAAEAGVQGRVERRLHDIAVDPDAIEPADIVVLHRVVCCYPDYERLLGAAAAHARRLLVFSHPRRQPDLAARRRRGEPRLPAGAARVPRLRPPARGDARGAGRARARAGFAERGFAWEARGLSRVSAACGSPRRGTCVRNILALLCVT